MSAIFDFFTNLINIITSIVDFIIGFFSDVVYIVQTLGQFVLKVPSMLGFLPSAVISVFVSVLAIVVIYKVIGRD